MPERTRVTILQSDGDGFDCDMICDSYKAEWQANGQVVKFNADFIWTDREGMEYHFNSNEIKLRDVLGPDILDQNG